MPITPVSTPPASPKRRTAPPFETIVEAAAELFGSKGYANTSMQDVADRVRIAKPTLYVHSKSKLGLLEAVYDQVLTDGDEVLTIAEEVLDPRQRLETFIARWTELTIRRRTLVHAFFANETELPAHLAEHYRAWSAISLHRIRAMVTRGQDAGAFRADLDATTVAFAIVSATQWTVRWWREEGDRGLDEVIRTQAALVLDGLRAR